MTKIINLLAIILVFNASLTAQNAKPVDITKTIQAYKMDTRGPYKDIRWFCKDGSTVSPQERCPEPGVQRARYKDAVIALANNQHIFLGQILSTTNNIDFWDKENNHSRLKQYQLEQYLKTNDDGWILRKAQYYRGASQIEDEYAWGIDFLNWLLADSNNIKNEFYIMRQAVKDIPHRIDDKKTQNVRAVSKNISDVYPAFMNLRIKIHGQPEVSDIKKVIDFKEQHKDKLNAALTNSIDELISDMKIMFKPVDISSIDGQLSKLPKDSERKNTLLKYTEDYNKLSISKKLMETSNILFYIRENISKEKSSKSRLILLDISIKLEEILFVEIGNWKTSNLNELMTKIYYVEKAAAGCGFVEIWEWDKISQQITPTKESQLSLVALSTYFESASKFTEWSTSMTRATYSDVISLYAAFEPLAYGYYDDIIRSSILLSLGQELGKLGDFISSQKSSSNKVLDLKNQSQVRGLNPGYAMGELVVLKEMSEDIIVTSDKIYVFKNAPSDLKPVAGIMTVSEGNLVSHVQLLARNLGIPNAVLSDQNLDGLMKYSGKKMFYAVSNKGTVILKPVSEMTEVEKNLFAVKQKNAEKIKVPVNKLKLEQYHVLNLREVNSSHSGKLCGPKAANLGQLKALFPNNVVEGIVIPFGIFKKHLDQIMPNSNSSYWLFLNDIFKESKVMENAGKTDQEIDVYVLSQLEIFRNAIAKMKFDAEFIKELRKYFKEVLGKDLGKIPVFLRSDTNMEDLKEFTGAGLNLTLFNVVSEEKILKGIKDVWASPYTERSYKWRQSYLLNPENVFPSILIIPSVDVDYSGVMITKGIASNNNDEITVAFSRGAGGAVDGQAAEMWLLKNNGTDMLLTPAREPAFNSLPEIGGTKTNFTGFYKPILNENNKTKLKQLTQELNQKLPNANGVESKGPYDVELGFKNDKLWLFQVRPFVENKKATSSTYLQSITPQNSIDKTILLNTKI